MLAPQHFFQSSRRQQVLGGEFLVEVNQGFRLQDFMCIDGVQDRLSLAIVKIHPRTLIVNNWLGSVRSNVHHFAPMREEQAAVNRRLRESSHAGEHLAVGL